MRRSQRRRVNGKGGSFVNFCIAGDVMLTPAYHEFLILVLGFALLSSGSAVLAGWVARRALGGVSTEMNELLRIGVSRGQR